MTAIQCEPTPVFDEDDKVCEAHSVAYPSWYGCYLCIAEETELEDSFHDPADDLDDGVEEWASEQIDRREEGLPEVSFLVWKTQS